jgi:hypothetical protein
MRTTERVSLGWKGQERAPEVFSCQRGVTELQSPGMCSGVDSILHPEISNAFLHPEISSDGRLVRFVTSSSNLVPDDTNGDFDIFVRDRVARTTECVTVASHAIRRPDGLRIAPGKPAGGSGNDWYPVDAFSRDGRNVVFSAWSPLVPEDTNLRLDVYVRDRKTGKTVRASVSSSGAQTPAGVDSQQATVSADGRYVAFQSAASNLTPSDANDATDVFVRDLVTRTTVRVSVTSAGEVWEGSATHPSISADGRVVSFLGNNGNVGTYDVGGATYNSPELVPPKVFVHERPR